MSMPDQKANSALSFSDGELIVAQGETDTKMFIILEGGAEASNVINGEKVLLQRFEAGDFFGEMSLLEGLPRSADIHAVGETRVTTIGGGGLMHRIRKDPTFALEMLKSLSSRLRRTTELYQDQVLERQSLQKPENGMNNGSKQDYD